MNYKLLGKNLKLNFTKEIFENRDMSSQEMIKYLNTTDSDIIDYSKLDDIDIAVDIFCDHLNTDTKILLVVDPDVDGLTSSALLYNFIKRIWKNAKVDYVMHEGKMHGLTEDVKVDIDKYSLIILPDAGSNQYELHKECYDKGIDVIVLDHHHTDVRSDYAVIVNNQLSKNYSNKSLSGVGVVWQFIRAVNEKRKFGEDINSFLDIVAVGLVADLMDLRSIETKHLISKGLKNINNTFIKEFCKKQSYSIGDTVTPFGIGWYIAPNLNAVVRVGTMQEKLLIFEAFLEDKASELIPSTKRGCKGEFEYRFEQAIRTAMNVKTRQDKIVDEGIEKIKKLILENKLDEKKVLMIAIEPDVLPAEVVGLVANKIAGEYLKPVLIGRKIKTDGIDYLSGSGRNFNFSPITNFRLDLEETNLVEYASGHGSAFGWRVKLNNAEELSNSLEEKYKDIDLKTCYYVDFEFDYAKEDKLLKECIFDIDSLDKLGLWGQGFSEPIIAIKNVPVKSNYLEMRGSKGDTLRIMLDIPFIKFRTSQEMYKELKPGFGIDTKYVTIIGKCNVNEWNGFKTPQIMIEDYVIDNSKKYIF